jgi:predicted AlkP superfamily phosphohydrolase/phosphomutase
MQTLVVGLDAATWSVMEPLLADGELPNLQSLLEEGVRGELQSTRPPMTPAAWTTMATGVDPSDHGVFDFFEQDPDSYRVRPTDFCRMARPAVWDVLARADVDIGVVNYPMARPPPEVDPFFVSGFPASGEQHIAHRAELQSRLDDRSYRVTPDADPEGDPEAYFRDVVDLTDARADLVVELLDRHDPALCWAVFMGIDWVQHYLWDEAVDGRDAVDAFYVHVDGVVGRLLEAVPDDASVVVVSDHGARKVEGTVHTNSLLEEWGYLSRSEERPSVTDRATRTVVDVLWRLGRHLPERTKETVESAMGEDRFTDLRAAAGIGQFSMHDEVDWTATRAFSYGYMGRVFLNREGRYGSGTVPASAADDLVAVLVERLESLTHPETGEPLVDRAVDAREVYADTHRERAPDVLFEPADWRYSVHGDFDDHWLTDPGKRTADHDPTGVVLASGPGFADEGRVDLTAAQLPAVLLGLHGLPLVEGMVRELPAGLLADGTDAPGERLSLAEFEVGHSVRGNHEDDVGQHLEDMGYL